VPREMSSRFYSSSAGLVTAVACFSSNAGAARAAREQPLLESACAPVLELTHAAALTKPLLLSQRAAAFIPPAAPA
jgi:hypothetical protein